MKLHFSTDNAELPECVLSGDDMQQMGFMPNTLFHIQQYNNGLMLTLAEPDVIPLSHTAEDDPYQGIDWVRDNGELYLAGDWLTETGLLDNPVQVAFGYGKIMLMTESDLIPV
ncbi:SymE family type I addiction module toxin [Xenorhabdus bovienii]|uniref:SymE family type I addiction module toxin n=1 Tax=Xenorhabdus bovienii TaxID=40576 RepID=UPI00237C778F|nr:SymE family type I addiction module toxin [Xenorhabdus bovienii]MDE1495139.1 SymE family type I addiction module toxin [Xenorhabdus bovienii]MDE9473223.1 SymE family type I addiction module toxin [Xenorhabdus bovienii]